MERVRQIAQDRKFLKTYNCYFYFYHLIGSFFYNGRSYKMVFTKTVIIIIVPQLHVLIFKDLNDQ